MRLSGRVKPISHLKAHAAELIREVQERQEPLVITQNGEATAVLIDVATFDQIQETVALLKIVAMGRRQAQSGDLQGAFDALQSIEEESAGR